MLILSEQEIQRMYTMKDAISDVKEMLRQKQAGKVITLIARCFHFRIMMLRFCICHPLRRGQQW